MAEVLPTAPSPAAIERGSSPSDSHSHSDSHSPSDWALPDKGRVGMVSLILTECAFFGTFVVVYLFYVGKSLSGPYPSEVLEVPVLNTICLLSSSITVVLAVRGLEKGEITRFSVWMLATVLLGAEFLVGTGLEWQGLIEDHGLWIDTNLFGTTFYSLVGFHALHVTLGLVLLSTVLILALLGHVKKENAHKVDMLSWYWHFVDAVWIVVLTTVYVVGV